MISTRSAGLLIDTVVCLTLAKWETVSGRFGGYLTHGTETKTSDRIYRRDGSCDSVDHPGGHDVGGGCAELVSDLPPSTFAFVLRRSTSFLPPTLDTRRRVAAISAGSVALPRPRP